LLINGVLIFERSLDLAAEDNLAFTLGWFDKFPEYKENEFYLTGESFAGIKMFDDRVSLCAIYIFWFRYDFHVSQVPSLIPA
jgi:hypothetical protein